MVRIEAAGGAVMRISNGEKEVLLIERNGIWDLPKGKRETGESVSECAVREVSEETGLKEVELTEFLGVTFHTYLLDGQNIEKKTYWYRMETADGNGLRPQEEEGITQVVWVNLEEARSLVGYQNLKDVLSRV